MHTLMPSNNFYVFYWLIACLYLRIEKLHEDSWFDIFCSSVYLQFIYNLNVQEEDSIHLWDLEGNCSLNIKLNNLYRSLTSCSTRFLWLEYCNCLQRAMPNQDLPKHALKGTGLQKDRDTFFLLFVQESITYILLSIMFWWKSWRYSNGWNNKNNICMKYIRNYI